MEKEPHLRSFGKREVEKIPASELLLAARYWASNTVIMSAADPWRSHLFALTFAALIAPEAADMEAWLRHAHKAVRGSSMSTSCYEQARLELMNANPPWLTKSASRVPGIPSLQEHEKSWSRELRLNEMGRLLEEIKADIHLGVAPNGLITL